MTMDVLCDTLLLEEVLPRLPPKRLLRLAATARRYNALARDPDFAARYWRRAGAFLQLQPADDEHRKGALPRSFLTAPSYKGTKVVLGEADDDLAAADDIVVHSAAGGLLLCSRGRPTRQTAYYHVINPVTGQRVALPELRGLCYDPQCALLTVSSSAAAAPARFQVVVIEGWQTGDWYLHRNIFSSDTGHWKESHLTLPNRPSPLFKHDLRAPPVVGRSGAAYWIQRATGEVIKYNTGSSLRHVIQLPVSGRSNLRHCCIGERHDGRRPGFRFARADASALEVWHSVTMNAWELAHQVGITELLGKAAELGLGRSRLALHHCHVKPIGFHPTDVDVVFLAFHAGVAAYSMERGTMDLQCTEISFRDPANVFPYVHPPYPVQIPPMIRHDLALELPRKRKAQLDLDGTAQEKKSR